MPQFPESYRLHGPSHRIICRRNGFTLLELLLVVTVLSAVAWMSLGVVGNNADQVRFEDTRNRLQAIRRAIIGDTSRTINGQPEVRGYVADMGGLPENLQALVSREYCKNHPGITTNAANECTDAGGTWVSQAVYAQDSTTGIWAGWNGPYLPPGFGSVGRFLDGWGRDDDSNNNFGWVYTVDSPNAGDLTIRSRGRDGVAGGDEPYDSDYPLLGAAPLIDESEYRIKVTDSGNTGGTGDATGGLRVDFGAPASCWVDGFCSDPLYITKGTCSTEWIGGSCSNPAYTTEATCESNGATWTWNGSCSISSYITEATCVSNGATWTWAGSMPRADLTISADCVATGTDGTWQPTENLCMAMIVTKGGIPVQVVSNGATSIQWDGTQKIAEFIFEDTTSATLDEDTYLYQGQMAYGIFEYDSTATPPVCDTTKPFPVGSALWKNFTYVPGTTLQPFERKINP
ncbi:prepilin-type N-terminal cleavage/methylation domain-containing protein [Desulfobulbus sp.]|uniref:prepilin-type N-terminal cleavage/methylation domain-containing protein n=1 Tax=Desulfobulbus sp. TaxID=895 RepID=UPI0027B8D8B0|nr:prepilin-type N-terminal cleavage/methylation domain-containing protein [Desulfobulbus sp.]